MTPTNEDFQAELLRLRNQVQQLATANARAAQLMAELEEAHEAERVLRADNAFLMQARKLEEHRARYLELVARNQPIGDLLSALADLLAHVDPALGFSFFLIRQAVLHHAISRNIPDEIRRQLEAEPGQVEAFQAAMGTRGSAIFRELGPETESVPFYQSLRTHQRFGIYAAPVTNSARVLGMIALYTPGFHRPYPELLERLREVSSLFAMGVEHRMATERLAHQAHHDVLTGLPNRTHFYEILQETLAQRRMDGRKAAVIWADLDRFKQINDTLGHRPADLLLQIVARRMTEAVGDAGIAGRMGGDEFVLLLQDLEQASEALEVAEAVLQAFRQPLEIGEHRLTVEVSLGVSIYPDHAEDAETLVRNADLAMYGAKKRGRNTVVCFAPEAQTCALQSFQLEFHLRRALERGELEPFYQPLVASRDGSIAAFETLLRWYSPELGAVSPAKFIPVAEASGLMHKIGAWVLERACRDASSWQKNSPGVRVAVNVSATQLGRGDFHRVVEHALQTSGLSPQLLELELTESTVLALKDYQQHTKALRKLGVSLAIDDFGTGYSSLSYLHKLQVDTLKIDRSFVSTLGMEEASTRLAETIIAMAKSLGLKVVAEGVENEEQENWLTGLECDYLQGYYLYHPMRVEDARDILQSCRLKPLAKR